MKEIQQDEKKMEFRALCQEFRANNQMCIRDRSIDTQDWKNRSRDAIVKEVLDHVQDGDIILMHDLRCV